MIDARREKRKAVMGFMPVHNVTQDAFLGYLSDLTTAGAMLVSEDPIEASENVTLSFDLGELSEISADTETRVAIPARVVWCQLRGQPAYYSTGFEFLGIPEADKRALRRTLRQY